MMPKSLLHQTLAKLISETDRSLPFFFSQSINKCYSTEFKKLCQALLFFYNNKKPRILWISGFVYTLTTLLIYTQTSDTGAHDPLSLNVRYSGHCFVMCISLSISVYMQLIVKKLGYCENILCRAITSFN